MVFLLLNVIGFTLNSFWFTWSMFDIGWQLELFELLIDVFELVCFLHLIDYVYIDNYNNNYCCKSQFK